MIFMNRLFHDLLIIKLDSAQKSTHCFQFNRIETHIFRFHDSQAELIVSLCRRPSYSRLCLVMLRDMMSAWGERGNKRYGQN
jgi:hypothetical protein